ncbi:hypothetical protein N7452_002976 [Penicillium brevicompactum]|uniref:Helicase ATP-binding domain-containing protein n=1 Tax=Penicillium brevicompactum TaxID=5074 RepID=A0A9W9QSW9_PENBR|nr:hypothetical protein N7452_002976 [Penicillium brevicompactum]
MARVFSFQAMQAGRQSVVAILPTGGGKSLLFQLHAFCSGLGTTIVVVPLIALQHNLHARNRGLNLRSEIWNGQKTPPGDTIFLVTPEATGTPAFLAFANCLAAEHRLDRIPTSDPPSSPCLPSLAQNMPSKRKHISNYHQRGWKAHPIIYGGLRAAQVAQKLNASGMAKDGFLSWSSPFNDVSCLRGWLEQEGFDGILPKDKYLHRDRMDFRQNLKEILGFTCWKSGSFPLSLETVFPVLCGFDHPLAGKTTMLSRTLSS